MIVATLWSQFCPLQSKFSIFQFLIFAERNLLWKPLGNLVLVQASLVFYTYLDLRINCWYSNAKFSMFQLFLLDQLLLNVKGNAVWKWSRPFVDTGGHFNCHADESYWHLPVLCFPFFHYVVNVKFGSDRKYYSSTGWYIHSGLRTCSNS